MPRPPKDRTEEINVVFKNLEYLDTTKLQELIKKSQELISKKKEAEIKEAEEKIKELQAKIDELKK